MAGVVAGVPADGPADRPPRRRRRPPPAAVDSLSACCAGAAGDERSPAGRARRFAALPPAANAPTAYALPAAGRLPCAPDATPSTGPRSGRRGPRERRRELPEAPADAERSGRAPERGRAEAEELVVLIEEDSPHEVGGSVAAMLIDSRTGRTQDHQATIECRHSRHSNDLDAATAAPSVSRLRGCRSGRGIGQGRFPSPRNRRASRVGAARGTPQGKSLPWKGSRHRVAPARTGGRRTAARRQASAESSVRPLAPAFRWAATSAAISAVMPLDHVVRKSGCPSRKSSLSSRMA